MHDRSFQWLCISLMESIEQYLAGIGLGSVLINNLIDDLIKKFTAG